MLKEFTAAILKYPDLEAPGALELRAVAADVAAANGRHRREPGRRRRRDLLSHRGRRRGAEAAEEHREVGVRDALVLGVEARRRHHRVDPEGDGVAVLLPLRGGGRGDERRRQRREQEERLGHLRPSRGAVLGASYQAFSPRDPANSLAHLRQVVSCCPKGANAHPALGFFGKMITVVDAPSTSTQFRTGLSLPCGAVKWRHHR